MDCVLGTPLLRLSVLSVSQQSVEESFARLCLSASQPAIRLVRLVGCWRVRAVGKVVVTAQLPTISFQFRTHAQQNRPKRRACNGAVRPPMLVG